MAIDAISCLFALDFKLIILQKHKTDEVWKSI